MPKKTPLTLQPQPELPTPSWDNILNCSHELLNLAKKSNWENMHDIAAQRDVLIKQYFADNPSDNKNAEQHKKQIKNLLAMDTDILNFYNTDHKSLSMDFQSLRKSSKALNAYHNCP